MSTAGRLVFLTGATGFIGSRLARRLVASGDRLRCYVRASSTGRTGRTGRTARTGRTGRTAELERLGAELVSGELTDVETLAGAMAGADLAYHLAAIYDVGVVDVVAMERTNVGGTAAFLQGVERAALTRAVYVSSTVALGSVERGSGDERTVHGPRTTSVYERTKLEAHRLALAAQTRGVPVVVVCPANVYGPGDTGPNGRFVADLLRGLIPGLPTNPSWFSYVHVDDVVEGLVLAGQQGRPDGVYVLSGEDRSLNEFAAQVCRLAGLRAPFLRLPAPLIRWTGTALDAVSRLTGARLPVTRENADTSSGLRWLHGHARATAEWGWTPRPLAAGLPEMVAEFQAGRGGADR